MASIHLSFEGVAGPLLPGILIAGLAAILLVVAGGQFLHRRIRLAGWCLLAGLLPGTLAGAVWLAGVWPTGWGWPALLAGQACLAVVALYATVYDYLGPWRQTLLVGLRCAAILAIAALLFKPVLTRTPTGGPPKPTLAVLVDRSGSMGTVDQPGRPSRHDQALQMLAAQQTRIGEHFQPDWRGFGTDVLIADDPTALGDYRPADPGGDATRLGAALRTVSAEHDRDNLAGLLVISDGIDNGPTPALDAAIASGVPLYAVSVGSQQARSTGQTNVTLTAASAPMEAVLNNVTAIDVDVSAQGLAGKALEVQLREDPTGPPLATARLTPTRDAQDLSAQLTYIPRAREQATQPVSDIRWLRLTVQPVPGETTPADNHAELHLLVTQPRVRVLYVEGSIRPEYKFLKRTLEADPDVQLMALVRIAGNRFLAQGAVEGRQLNRLPMAEADFKLFDVILIGDLDRTFWTDAQMKRLRAWVNDGGGLAMLGGHNSFGPGGYAGTDIEAVLPVEVGLRGQPQETQPFGLQLTAEGQAHPVLAGITGFFAGPGGTAATADVELPELSGCVTVKSVKPSATVLAVHPSPRTQASVVPVLAVHRFGGGRVAAFGADTTWRWYLPTRPMAADSPHARFWGQLVRWLARVGVKSRDAAASVLARVEPGRSAFRAGADTVTLRARVQSAQGTPATDATVQCVIAPTSADGPPSQANGQPTRIALAPTLSAGVYEAKWQPREPGEFTLRFSARDPSDATLGSDELAVRVLPHSAELERVAARPDVLAELAERTGGAHAPLASLPEVLDRVIERSQSLRPPGPQVQTTRLYHFPILFAVAVALLTGEWLARRSWQLQ